MAENRSKKREHPTSLDNLGDEYVLTVPELATILKMSRVKMNEMLATGKIEGAFRVGRCVRIQVKDVKIWMESEKLPKNKDLYRIRQSLRRAG